jgi:hypothetical protein
MDYAIIQLAPGQLPKDAEPGAIVNLAVTAEVTEGANAVNVLEVSNVSVAKAAPAAPATENKPSASKADNSEAGKRTAVTAPSKSTSGKK